MAFCFKRKESVTKGIARLACERIENALDCVKDFEKPDAIHGARKEIKKAKAVLRLARASISKKEYRRAAKRLRKASRFLAPMRDAEVKATTLRQVTRRFKGQLAPGPFRAARVELRR